MMEVEVIGKVVFEYVSPFKHPEAYQNERPVIAPADVPADWWTRVETVKAIDVARSQYEGLQRQEREGELVRSPELYEGVRRITWTRVWT